MITTQYQTLRSKVRSIYMNWTATNHTVCSLFNCRTTTNFFSIHVGVCHCQPTSIRGMAIWTLYRSCYLRKRCGWRSRPCRQSSACPHLKLRHSLRTRSIGPNEVKGHEKNCIGGHLFYIWRCKWLILLQHSMDDILKETRCAFEPLLKPPDVCVDCVSLLFRGKFWDW